VAKCVLLLNCQSNAGALDLQVDFVGSSSANDVSLQDSDVDGNDMRQSPSSRKRYVVPVLCQREHKHKVNAVR